MSELTPTPSQTIGPFFGFALPYPQSGHIGDELHLSGRVFDGSGQVITDALVETLQADSPLLNSRFARSDTRSGRFHVHTNSPPPSAAYLALIVHARGLLQHLHTRVYLPDAVDQIPDSLPPHRRERLLATREGDTFTFDIYLQGAKETVFFDV